MTRRLAQQLVLAAFAIALLLAPLASLTPRETAASRTPNSFHWARKQTQFTLQVGDNVDGGWNSLLTRVVADWNRGDTVTFRVVGGSTNPQECRERQGTVQVCNWRYGTQAGWLGLTRLYFNDRGDHVDAATVMMNDSFLNAGNSQYNSEAARRHTLCHELGHTPGLDHVSTKSCMNDSQEAVFDNLVPINKDFRQLERIYQHKDSTTTVAGKQKKQKKNKKKQDAKDGKNRNGKKSKQEREKRKQARERLRERKRARNEGARSESFFDPTSLPAVPSGADSNETVTVETLDDGRTVVTFITWADEVAVAESAADE